MNNTVPIIIFLKGTESSKDASRITYCRILMMNTVNGYRNFLTNINPEKSEKYL